MSDDERELAELRESNKYKKVQNRFMESSRDPNLKENIANKEPGSKSSETNSFEIPPSTSESAILKILKTSKGQIPPSSSFKIPDAKAKAFPALRKKYEEEREKINTIKATALLSFDDQEEDLEESTVNKLAKGKQLKEHLRQSLELEDLKTLEDFGRKKDNLGADTIVSIHNSHKRTKKIHPASIDYDITVEEDPDLVGPKIPEGLGMKDEEESDEDEEEVGPRPYEYDGENEGYARFEEDIINGQRDDRNRRTHLNVIDDEMEPIIDDYKIPMSHEIELNAHHKPASGLDIDNVGNRIISGGYDFDMYFWDFQGMNKDLNYFRKITPCDGYPIGNLSFNCTGGFILICATNHQVKILTRDGATLAQCIKGDMYIRDMNHTKGHVSQLTNAVWHPSIKTHFLSSSMDGTLRTWDIDTKLVGIDQQLMQNQVIKTTNSKGHKTVASTCCYDKEGTKIVAGCTDGTIKIWGANGPYHRPDIIIQRAHIEHNDVSSLCFYKDGRRLLSRNCDDTLKLWDIRNTKRAVNVWGDLQNFSSSTQVSLSPDEKLIMTGDSVKRGQGNGKLYFYNSDTFENAGKIEISPHMVIRSIWHPVINQILVSSGDGKIRVLYSPEYSKKGALQCILKTKSKIHEEDETIYQRPIITPHALPQFKENETQPPRRGDKDYIDPAVVRRPELPLSGPLGKGGRISAAGTYTQFIMKNMNKLTKREEDPREALLKYANASEADPQWVTPAYSSTQPKTIFDYSAPKVEGIKYLEEAGNKICPRCGLKFCVCTTKKTQ